MVALTFPPRSACVCCGSGAYPLRTLTDHPQYLLFGCSDCGLKFLRSDTNESLGDDDEYWDVHNRHVYTLPAVRAEFERKHRGILAGLNPVNNRILDVGSGCGIFLSHARQNGFEAHGIEPSVAGRALCSERFGIGVFPGYLTPNSTLRRDYGVLTAWDVIEHVDDPQGFLKVCHEHLADDGILILETPDESSFIRKLVSLFSRFKDLSGRVYYPSHRYYFTRDSLGYLLARVGFKNIQFRGDHSMIQKSIEKYRAYRKAGFFRMLLCRLTYGALRLRPFWNKQIVICRKA